MTLFSDGRLKMQYQTVPWQNTQNGMSGQYDGNNGVDQADKYDKPTIGIENADDIIADVEQALAAAG